MNAATKTLTALAALAFVATTARADAWGIAIGGGNNGKTLVVHYSSGGGNVAVAAPVYVGPARVLPAPAPVPVVRSRIIHVSPQVVTHRSWRLGPYGRPMVCAPPLRNCAPPRPVVVVAGRL